MRTFAAAWLLTLVVAAAGTLEVEQGNVRLVLHEESSRHSIYLRHEGEWIPLFLAEDPRTSVLEVLENNRIHTMGDSGSFGLQVDELPDGARYVWTSPTLRVEQRFRFTRGVDSAEYDAIAMTVDVTNEGEAPSLVGVRVIYDTYLGERANVHFVTPASSGITRETSLTPGPANRYVASVPSADATYGFQIMLDGAAVAPPETAVVANWKRLTDSTWDYEANESRNFNRLPYSINDSAVLLAFGTEQLASGGKYSVTTYVGDLAPQGYVSPDVAAGTTGANLLLERLREVVDQIDALIARDEVDPAEVTALQEELRTLTELVRGR